MDRELEKRFTLTVTGTQGGEWQGVLRLPDDREKSFQSVLQLLAAIQQELDPAPEK